MQKALTATLFSNLKGVTFSSSGSASAAPLGDAEAVQDSISISDRQIKVDLADLHRQREKVKCHYESIISSLEQIIESILAKNEFLIADRDGILLENETLKNDLHSLQCVLAMKNALNDSSRAIQPIFDVIVAERRYKADTDRSEGIKQLLESAQKSLARDPSNAFFQATMSVSIVPKLDLNHSLNYKSQQANLSFSNFQQSEVKKCPDEQGQIQIRCEGSFDGIVRAFYLSVLQSSLLSKQLIRIIEQIELDCTVELFEAYPTNMLWTGLLVDFIQQIHKSKFESEGALLDYLKKHSLIDTLLLKVIKSRIAWVFESESGQEVAVETMFTALGNLFQLKMKFIEGKYIFLMSQQKEKSECLLSHGELNESNDLEECTYDIPMIVLKWTDKGLQLNFRLIQKSFRAKQQDHLQSFAYSENSQHQANQLNRELSNAENSLRANTDSDHKMLRRMASEFQDVENFQPSSNTIREDIKNPNFFLQRVNSNPSSFSLRDNQLR